MKSIKTFAFRAVPVAVVAVAAASAFSPIAYAASVFESPEMVVQTMHQAYQQEQILRMQQLHQAYQQEQILRMQQLHQAYQQEQILRMQQLQQLQG